MTYEQAVLVIDKNKDIIGKPLGQYSVEHMVIAPFDNLSDVLLLYMVPPFDNKKALVDLGFIDNDNLNVYLFPAKYIPVMSYDELENYLLKMGRQF